MTMTVIMVEIVEV